MAGTFKHGSCKAATQRHTSHALCIHDTVDTQILILGSIEAGELWLDIDLDLSKRINHPTGVLRPCLPLATCISCVSIPIRISVHVH